MSVASSWLQNVPSSPKLWFDTDIGNDIDDVLALLCCMNMYGRDKLFAVSTTFYRPDQKARIARTILDAYQYKDTPVYAGIGIYNPEKEGEAMLKSKYPTWPAKRFNVPWAKDSLSAKESAAYRKNFANFDDIPVNTNAIDALKKAIEKERENLVLLALGFPTNIAAVLEQAKQYKVNRIVLMGGWFEDEKGEVKRPGYNTGVDLAATKAIFEQKEINVLVVSSEFCKQFAINKQEYDMLQEKGLKIGSKLIAKAICEDMQVWMEGKNQADSQHLIHIGDPLAAYLACHPEEIAEATPVEIQVGAYKEGVDLFSPEAKDYLKVKRVAQSNIMVVRSVKNPEKLRSSIVEYVSRAFDWKKL